jgi:Na+/citrate or Na+/malate symporter
MQSNTTGQVTAVAEIVPPDSGSVDEGFWPKGWWKLLDFRIGVIPFPVYVLLVILIVGFAVSGSVPSEVSMFIAILAVGGFTCAELGKRLPILRNVGAAAIFATFIPSALAYYHLLPDPILKLVVDFTKFTNFLYLFIASIIVGSILSMDRQVLIKGFIKIFVPLAIGSIVRGNGGTAVGMIGFVVARFLNMYPIDVAIVNACHSGQGGTGDVAILTAANRMQLMPFAQIATRIGGAITVTVVLIILSRVT